MFLPDVNILIYAFRSDTPHHSLCRRWLNTVIEGEAAFGIAPTALAAVVRIVTNHKIFSSPSPLDEAFGFCRDLRDQPHCQIIEPEDRHWDIFERLCVASDTRGSRVSDAWFAALAIEWGCTWITLDRDYARFPGLNWRGPDA